MDKRILIVDDEAPLREMLRDLFSRRGGYTIVTASGGEEALTILRRENFDAIFLDVKMAPMDGLEALKKIREIGFKNKILMLTAMDDAAIEKTALANGANGFLSKQIDLQKFLKAERESTGKPGHKILIADDNPGICDVLKEFLIKKCYVPVVAGDGADALEKVKRENPAIVLLDITMPGIDGLVVLQRMKSFNEKIKVIMITGAGDEQIAKQAVTLGAFDYLVKPVDLNYLEKCLLVAAIGI
jgi:CheY-like chemotaxis protein